MSIARAGFVCFGEINTPKEIIGRKDREARKLLQENGLELVCTDPVSDDPKGEDSRRAVRDLSREDFDLLILCVAGWIPSHTVFAVTDPFRHKPMLLWGLTGWMEGKRLVTTADQAGTSALRKPMQDMDYRFKYVYEVVGAPARIGKVLSFARAARTANRLRGARVGMMGYRDMNLYGTLFDGVSMKSTFGVEIEFFEMLEMVQRAEKLKTEEIRSTVAEVKKNWKFVKPAQADTLEKGAAYYLAVRDKVRERGYSAVSLIDVDGMKKLLNFPPSMIFTLLSENPRICTIPENDSMGALTQLVVHYLSGQIAPYFEFYEFMEDRVLVGVPDFVPSEIVDGPVTVLPSKFGQLGEGVLNISKVKTGPVTLCRLTYRGDAYALHVVTGEAVQPRAWEEAGWAPPAPQLPGLEIILDSSVEEFAQNVLSQHYILAYGNWVEDLNDFCRLLGIEVIPSLDRSE